MFTFHKRVWTALIIRIHPHLEGRFWLLIHYSLHHSFSPLEGFMNEDVYDGVVENMRIPGSNLIFG